jgi:hypothetical protein
MEALYQLPIFPYLRPILLAGLAGFAAYYAARHFSFERPSASRLKKAAGVIPGRSDVKVGSGDFRIRLVLEKYGVPVIGNELITRILAVAVLGTVLSFVVGAIGAPPMVSLASYLVAWFIVDSQISGAWSSFVEGIEKEVPTFLTRLSSVVQLEPNVLQAMNSVMETLEEGKPLRGWISKFIARVQSQGQTALEELQEEAQAISPSLGLTVFEAGKMLGTGGEGYVKAFKVAAENVRSTLQARASGNAKAAGAKSANQLMIAAVLVAMVFMMRSGSFSEFFAQTSNQLIEAAIIAWMFFGWSFINNFIRSRL